MTTPSTAAVAKALETTQHDRWDVPWPDTGWGRCTPGHLCGLCTEVAFALDTTVREREAAVWEEAAKVIRENTLWSREDLARTFEARAAEERGKL